MTWCLQMTWFMTFHDIVTMTSQETNCTWLFNLACPFWKYVCQPHVFDPSTVSTHPNLGMLRSFGDQVPREQDGFLCKSKSWELPTAHGALDTSRVNSNLQVLRCGETIPLYPHWCCFIFTLRVFNCGTGWWHFVTLRPCCVLAFFQTLPEEEEVLPALCTHFFR